MGRNALITFLLLLCGCATPIPCPTEVGFGAGEGLYFTLWFQFVEKVDDCYTYQREFWIEEEEEEEEKDE